MEVPGARLGLWAGGPPGGWSGRHRFNHADDIMDRTVVVSAGDAAGFRHLRRGGGERSMGEALGSLVNQQLSRDGV